MKNLKLNFVVAVVLLAVSSISHAALDAIEKGYELGISELTLPAHSAGQIVINGCEECESAIHPVNSQTIYEVGDTRVSLSDFRAAVSAEVGTFIYVAYSLETNFVTRVTLAPSE